MDKQQAAQAARPARRDLGAMAHVALAAALLVLLVAFVAGALGRDGGLAAWLPVAAGATAVAACAASAARGDADRGAWGAFAAAAGVWTLGSAFLAVRGGSPPAGGATFADACHVAFYPLAYAGLVQLVRARARRFAATLWLDGLIGALAVASVATGMLLPEAIDGGGDATAAIALRLVLLVGDLLLLAFVAGVIAMSAWRPGRAWIVLAAGFGALGLTHAIELTHTAAGVGSSGVPDLLWPVALGLLALAARHPTRLRPQIRQEGWGLLVAPTLFGWLAVGLVGYGNFRRLGPLGLALAGLTLLLVMLRAALTFRENAALARELSAEAAGSTRDGLTGLPGHRAFQEALGNEVRIAQRAGRPLSVVIFDVDDFRAINELHGHSAGDAVLADIAERIAGILRGEDMLARTGGDELACLLPSTSAQAAWRAAERARAAVEAHPFDEVGAVTVSAGICDMSVAADGRELLRLAGGALYWAKTHGRNVAYRYSPDAMDVLSAEDRADQAERARTLSAITALARAVDAKDATTQRHSERVGALAAALAGVLGWPAERRARIHEAGLVHDVGKIGVPDAILRKTSRLTPIEAAAMEGHAALGARIVQDVLSAEQALWVLHHHERWDGLGYPHRLAGDDIPVGAQVLAVADAWDAMTADRHYRGALGPSVAIRELRDGSGRQWSPRVVDALLVLWRAGRLLPASRPFADEVLEPAESVGAGEPEPVPV